MSQTKLSDSTRLEVALLDASRRTEPLPPSVLIVGRTSRIREQLQCQVRSLVTGEVLWLEARDGDDARSIESGRHIDFVVCDLEALGTR